MDTLAAQEMLSRLVSTGADVEILPSVLSPTQSPQSTAVDTTVDTTVDQASGVEVNYSTASTSPLLTSLNASSRSSTFATDTDDDDVEEIIREAPLCRRDASHDVALSSWGLAPLKNFGRVMPGIYRSGYPAPENVNFLKTLNLKTILTLVPGEYPSQLKQYITENGIRHVQVGIEPNKDPFITISQKNMVRALAFVLDRTNHPMLIHCNKGKHRTGCVVGCFRKVLGTDFKSISAEYNHYAGTKARQLDERFISKFEERSMLWLASENNFLPRTEPMYESPVSTLVVSTRLRS